MNHWRDSLKQLESKFIDLEEEESYYEKAQKVASDIMEGKQTFEEACADILHNAIKKLGGIWGDLVGQLLVLKDGILVIIQSTNESESDTTIDPASSISGKAMKDKTRIYIPDLDNIEEPLRSLYKPVASGMKSELAVPMVTSSGEAVGVINLESPRKIAFDESHINTVALYARQAAQVIVWGKRCKSLTDS